MRHKHCKRLPWSEFHFCPKNFYLFCVSSIFRLCGGWFIMTLYKTNWLYNCFYYLLSRKKHEKILSWTHSHNVFCFFYVFDVSRWGEEKILNSFWLDACHKTLEFIALLEWKMCFLCRKCFNSLFLSSSNYESSLIYQFQFPNAQKWMKYPQGESELWESENSPVAFCKTRPDCFMFHVSEH